MNKALFCFGEVYSLGEEYIGYIFSLLFLEMLDLFWVRFRFDACVEILV